jgi:hypothetical protein
MILDFTVLREIVESYLHDNFTLCQVKYENVPLDTSKLDEWIAVFDKPTFSESTGLGMQSALTGGVLVFQIFTPRGTGTQRAREIANELVSLFGEESISGVALLTPELHSVPNNESWHQKNLQVPYLAIMGQEITC